VSGPNLVKTDRCEVAEKLFTNCCCLQIKNPGVKDTSEPPISPPLSQSRPKFCERCRPLSCVCTDFGPNQLQFARYIPERVQKSQYNNRLKAATQAFSLQILRKGEEQKEREGERRTASPMFHQRSTHLISGSYSVLEVKKYFTFIFTSYNMAIKLQIST